MGTAFLVLALLRETGRVGPLYYSYIIAMSFALVFALIGMLLMAR